MADNEENRPSPEALLAEAKREARGKLKIFIGAAPGVGKTFSMLRAAQAKKQEGIDVAVGIVETHRRSETETLLAGLEIIPRLDINYRGIPFQEMDLDAVLKRAPKLVLIDELAHSNIPGSRHPKRYQDVEELLDAGIDVYSTLNVQHIESLNDIVARITGVTVRETVPDDIVQKADSIELIDLTPEELLQRLKEGKVYIPAQARLAMGRFFTAGNLTALRELALRQAAARVDEQMADYMRSHAIEGPWPTSERILVCIAGDGQSLALIRTAKRSAERRHVPWLALYVETHHHAELGESARQEIAQALRLAESLGGETQTVAAEDVAGEVLRVAREKNVSVIIIGRSVRTLGSRLLRPSVAAALLDRNEDFDILVMSGNEDKRPRKDDGPRPARPWFTGHWRAWLEATLVVGLASIVAAGAGHLTDPPTLGLIYLVAVMLLAVDRDIRVSLYAAILSGVAFDFLFLPPRYSLMIDQHQDFLLLSFFLVVAAVACLIGSRLQKQIAVTRHNARRTQALYDFDKAIAQAVTLDNILQTMVRHVAATLKARAAVLLPEGERLEMAALYPDTTRLDTASTAAMDWAFSHGRPAGFKSDTLPGAAFYGLPLRAGNETVGVLAVQAEDGAPLSPDQMHLLDSFANLSAVAIQRTRLAGDIEQARLETETERLRSSLLSSVSHDLRTPLVAILGATTSLRDYWDKFDNKARRELFGTIEEEAGRLDRFVQNLLDMTQLVAGGLKLKRQPIDVQDLIGAALGKLRKQLGGRPLRLDIPDNLPPIDGDFAILERVLVNILDNACKYAPEDQPVTVTARREAHYIGLTITDRGAGIPEEERERVFDMFYRVKVGATPTAGAGLGLAICRGFIEAHEGRINALPGTDGIGTQIVLRLPISESR
ncbi:MAG TPA: sensor histidine kinase KdpD [Alphaproteobacteria bacterium]|nr:sensor histidine kinase KdpD [Alphaproteobacteria bacterium]